MRILIQRESCVECIGGWTDGSVLSIYATVVTLRSNEKTNVMPRAAFRFVVTLVRKDADECVLWISNMSPVFAHVS